MTLELDETEITWPTYDRARVRIKGGKEAWQTQVEVNGRGVPCTALKYEADIHGVSMLTLTFPAVVQIDATMEAGRIVLKSDTREEKS